MLEAVVVGEKPLDARLEERLLLAQIEIHQSPRIALAMMFFWISFEPP